MCVRDEAWLEATRAPTCARRCIAWKRSDASSTRASWGLEMPLVVRGREISSVTLAALPPGCYDGRSQVRAPDAGDPLARGLDVRLLQLGLSDRGVDILADGIFGRTSFNLLKAWQAQHGLAATGIADPP